MPSGLVLKATGSRYDVLDGERTIVCRLRGKIRLEGSRATNPVVVGDVVDYQWDAADDISDGASEALITAIHPRRNYIIRRASNLSKESHVIAANIDLAVVVATLSNPVTSYEFIDRFLVTCEAYHIPAVVALNKIDLARREPQRLQEFKTVYTKAGYPVIELSATEGEGIETLRELLRGGCPCGPEQGLVDLALKGRTTLVAGNSGVGKSSLIRALEPAAAPRIGEVSASHRKGKHTTTFSQLYPLAGGGYLIDTPGVKGFGLIDLTPRELCRYMPDMMRLAPQCRYYNCTHTHEPDCAVIDAASTGEVSRERYESYLKMVEDDEKYR
ncbi:MAG: ribosome small subunit-dependent GTPase A [Rikenellaceae bacterium]|nr:ribosome small subunit-dependent GTPase A [Rikenellaceae bacterium]